MHIPCPQGYSHPCPGGYIKRTLQGISLYTLLGMVCKVILVHFPNFNMIAFYYNQYNRYGAQDAVMYGGVANNKKNATYSLYTMTPYEPGFGDAPANIFHDIPTLDGKTYFEISDPSTKKRKISEEEQSETAAASSTNKTKSSAPTKKPKKRAMTHDSDDDDDDDEEEEPFEGESEDDDDAMDGASNDASP